MHRKCVCYCGGFRWFKEVRWLKSDSQQREEDDWLKQRQNFYTQTEFISCGKKVYALITELGLLSSDGLSPNRLFDSVYHLSERFTSLLCVCACVCVFRAWRFIMDNFRRKGSLLVTVPSLQESLNNVQVRHTHTYTHTHVPTTHWKVQSPFKIKW